MACDVHRHRTVDKRGESHVPVVVDVDVKVEVGDVVAVVVEEDVTVVVGLVVAVVVGVVVSQR